MNEFFHSLDELSRRRFASYAAKAFLGVGLLPVLVDASSYYSAAFLAYGFLSTRQPAIGAALCLLCVAGWAAAGGWLAWDDITAATSAGLLLFVAAAACLLAAGRGAERA